MIAIIGAGISGLSLAIELQKWCEPCVVIEKDNQPGGVIRTRHLDGYVCEYGANTIHADQEIKEYISKLNLDEEIILPESSSRKRYIFRNGRYHAVPVNPLTFLTTSLLSLNAKINIVKEIYKKPEKISQESLGAFIERRFNKEIAEYLLAPFISGIYAGDVNALQLSETFPILAEYEEKYGSVIKGFIQNRKIDRKESLYFKGGMQTLTDAMSKLVKRLRLNSTVESLIKTEEGYTLKVNQQGIREILHCSAVVFATPPTDMANLLSNDFADIKGILQKISYVPIVKTFFGFNRKDIKSSINGFGALNPPCENQSTLGSIWNSSILPHTAPADKFLITCISGGAFNKEILKLSEDKILSATEKELRNYFKIEGKSAFRNIHTIPRAIPQYDNNLQHATAKISALRQENIYVNANWVNGPSLGDCIKKSKRLALQLTEAMSGIAEYKGCC